MSIRKPVILDHDGGHDDLVALALLLANPDKVEVIGCIVTDADCIAEHAYSVTGKLMTLMHCCEQTNTFPIACSSFHGVNPFPSEWRWHAKNMDDLPCLNIPEHLQVWEKLKEEQWKYTNAAAGEQLLADLVINSEKKVTICVTGPLSNVAWCIDHYGEDFCSNVEECIIMGGAVHVNGNVFVNDRTDGTAEWNIFWDPPAAQKVLTCASLKVVLFSLDSTNHVPVISSVVQRFGAQNNYLLSQFVGAAWASCTHYALMRPNDGYYAWDVLTAAFAIDSSLAEVEQVALDVITDSNHCSEGRTICINHNNNNNNNNDKNNDNNNNINKCNIWLAKNTRADFFYDMVLTSMRRAHVKTERNNK